MMHFGKRQVHCRTFYSFLGTLIIVLFLVVSALGVSYSPYSTHFKATSWNQDETVFPPIKPGATAVLISKLKYYGLWKLPPTGKVAPYLIKTYPADLNSIDNITVKKRVFLHSLLPHALFVRQEALQRRQKLETILGKIECSRADLDFDAGYEYESKCSWTDFLAKDEVHFIQNLCRNYRTTSAEGLLERVDAVPTSIILAQGALESSWGSSRFTREGNSIFGMWTWKTAGIVPSKREEGKTHKVKIYESILDSVRAYHLTLNRLESYDQFRQLRQQTDDPLILADGLNLYSQRGEEYVKDIKKVIMTNDLQKYDKCSLTDSDQPGFPGPVTSAIINDGLKKSSL